MTYLTKESEYFSYRGEDCTDVFAEKMRKNYTILQKFS